MEVRKMDLIGQVQRQKKQLGGCWIGGHSHYVLNRETVVLGVEN